MGKKGKTGKSRRDKFYHLAKETGYRSRAAFKLLQLNSKYEFLPKSRVCVDLCAAPGGWLQVAAQNMPVSSIIIGIDLVPIKPIHGVTALQGDITTEKCRQDLKKELQTWDADVFLNDGAPNVGQTWVYDAFKQAELTLAALKLASLFLKKGGWFVTKVFRSKDYHALMWVFKQLFKKVFATKPQASRNESAEIFVVCQYFIKPDKLDPKFLDPKYVFQDVEKDEKKEINVLYQRKQKKRAEGYEDGDMTLHHKLKVSTYLAADDFVDMMAEAHEIDLDMPKVANHPLTTTEIKECLKDIKVLGKREINAVLKWRKKMIKFLETSEKEKEESAKKEEDEGSEENGMEDEEDEKKLDDKIAELHEQEAKTNKRKRKKVMKEKRKLRDKMDLNMIIPGDTIDQTDDIDLFDLKKMKSEHHLKQVEDEEMSDASSMSDSDIDEPVPNTVKYDRDEDDDVSDDNEEEDEEDGDEESDVEEDLEMEEVGGSDDDHNPLVVDLETKDFKALKKMDLWFNKDIFSGMKEEEDEDFEMDQVAKDYVSKGGTLIGQEKEQKKKRKHSKLEEEDSGNASESVDEDSLEVTNSVDAEEVESDDLRDSDSDDSDSDSSLHTSENISHTNLSSKSHVAKDGFEIVSQSKVVKLDPLELAIGEELIKSSKRRREIIELSYNRYTNNDDGLPDWFVKEESKHRRKQMPVSKDQIETYKEKEKTINVRTIKKVAEAKARKKKKAMKKLEKARKKSEVVTDAVDVTEREKWRKIQQIYKKAGVIGKKKPEVTYVVTKKGAGKKVRRPAGVKGQFKVVDPRLKKDTRSMMKAKTKGKPGRKNKQGKGKGGKR